MIAPARFNRSTTVASNGGTYPLRIFEPAVVSTPAVDRLSLMTTGMPVNAVAGDSDSPASIASASAAVTNNDSRSVTVSNALVSGSVSPMRCR